jgi:hypothetical protein
MDLMTLITKIPGVGPYIPDITLAVTIFGLIATRLPPPKLPASGPYAVAYGIVNWIALNFGKAKNAGAPGTISTSPPAAVFALIALGLALSACQTGPAQIATTANAALTKAQQDAKVAVTLYGIAKGIGQVAAAADPSLAPTLAKVTAAAEPVVAKAQIALADVATDAPTLEALAATIITQANALTVTAAPAVTVVPTPAG